jgi:hypothetical protein
VWEIKVGKKMNKRNLFVIAGLLTVLFSLFVQPVMAGTWTSVSGIKNVLDGSYDNPNAVEDGAVANNKFKMYWVFSCADIPAGKDDYRVRLYYIQTTGHMEDLKLHIVWDHAGAYQEHTYDTFDDNSESGYRNYHAPENYYLYGSSVTVYFEDETSYWDWWQDTWKYNPPIFQYYDE